MKILEETKNLKLKQNLEKLLLISTLSLLPNSSTPNSYDIQNYQFQNNISQPNYELFLEEKSQLNNFYGGKFQNLRYDFTPKQIEEIQIKPKGYYTI